MDSAVRKDDTESKLSLVCGKYLITSERPLTDEQAQIICAAISGSAEAKAEVLGGRAGGISVDLPSFGRLFIKKYVRGGIRRFILADRFASGGVRRAAKEMEMLKVAGSLGVNAPVPVACIVERRPLRRVWLAMDEIVGARNLVPLAEEDEDLVHEVMADVARQVLLLVKNNILHVDLHPGNVMVDNRKKVFLLDFDKAARVKLNSERLRDLYLRRWRRAVIKHRLPPFLSELMSLHLRLSNGQI